MRNPLRALVDAQQRTQRAVARMAGGSVDGRVAQAAPIPDRPRADRYRALAAGSGGGGVLLVASADAHDDVKAQAWVVCDGTADEVDIQAAIDALESTGYGGIVQLSEGGFWCSTGSEIDLNTKYVTMLRGGGNGVSYIVANTGVVNIDATNCQYVTLCDFYVDGSIWIDGAAHLRIERLEVGETIEASSGGVAALDTGFLWIKDCAIDGSNASGFAIDYHGSADASPAFADVFITGNTCDDGGIRLTSSAASASYGFNVVVTGNTFGNVGAQNLIQKCQWVVWSGNSSDETTFEDCGAVAIGGDSVNQVQGVLRLTDCVDVAVAGCFVEAGAILTTCTRVSISGSRCSLNMFDSNDCTIVGNTMDAPIIIDGSSRNVVSANRVADTGSIARLIDLRDGSHDNVVSENMLTTAGGSDTSNAAIEVGQTAVCHRNKISGNMVRITSTGDYNYGVRVAAGCNDNVVTDNDAFGAWDTAAVLDSGTGTVNTGNR